jgi:hypothetical protein
MVVLSVCRCYAERGVLPNPSMVGCPYAGPCHLWPELLAGFLFVFLSLVLGPKLVSHLVFVFVLLTIWSIMEPLRTGELELHMVLEIFAVLPRMLIFQGGMVGAFLGYSAVLLFRKMKRDAKA